MASTTLSAVTASLSACVTGTRPSVYLLSSAAANGGCTAFAFRRNHLAPVASGPAGALAGRARPCVLVRAAKLPEGVPAPKEQPRLSSAIFGFTTNAEILNSRSAMIGLIALVILEWATGKGILEMLGLDIGKGLNIPL